MLSDELRCFIQNKKIATEFVKRAKECGRNIYLYGAGYNLRFTMQFMRKHEIKIEAILDTCQERAIKASQ